MLRTMVFDVLVFDLTVDRESGLAVAMMAEFHQPDIMTILVSAQSPQMLPDLFSRLSSLKFMCGNGTPPDDLVNIIERLGRISASITRRREMGESAETMLSPRPDAGGPVRLLPIR